MFWRRKKDPDEPKPLIPAENLERPSPFEPAFDKFPVYDGTMDFRDWADAYFALICLLSDKAFISIWPSEELKAVYDSPGLVSDIQVDGTFTDEPDNVPQDEHPPIADEIFASYWRDGLSYRRFKEDFGIERKDAQERALRLGLPKRTRIGRPKKTETAPAAPDAGRDLSEIQKQTVRKMVAEGAKLPSIAGVIGRKSEDVTRFMEQDGLSFGEDDPIILTYEQKKTIIRQYSVLSATQIRNQLGLSNTKPVQDYIQRLQAVGMVEEKTWEKLCEQICDLYEVRGYDVETTEKNLRSDGWDVGEELILRAIAEHDLRQGAPAS